MDRAPLIVQIIALIVIIVVAVPLHIVFSLLHTIVFVLRTVLSRKRFSAIHYETLDHHQEYRKSKVFDFTVKFFKLWHLMLIELNDIIRGRKNYFHYDKTETHAGN